VFPLPLLGLHKAESSESYKLYEVGCHAIDDKPHEPTPKAHMRWAMKRKGLLRAEIEQNPTVTPNALLDLLSDHKLSAGIELEQVQGFLGRRHKKHPVVESQDTTLDDIAKSIQKLSDSSNWDASNQHEPLLLPMEGVGFRALMQPKQSAQMQLCMETGTVSAFRYLQLNC